MSLCVCVEQKHSTIVFSLSAVVFAQFFFLLDCDLVCGLYSLKSDGLLNRNRKI